MRVGEQQLEANAGEIGKPLDALESDIWGLRQAEYETEKRIDFQLYAFRGGVPGQVLRIGSGTSLQDDSTFRFRPPPVDLAGGEYLRRRMIVVNVAKVAK